MSIRIRLSRRIGLSRRVGRFVRKERGAQFVELALVLPVMLLLMGATVEFGRYYYTYTTLANAVRAGARHACKWEKNASWTIPETRRMVVYGDFSDTSKGPILPGLQESQVIVQSNGPSVNKIDSVTVKISGYQYKPIFDLGKFTGVPSLSLKVNVSPSVTMKQIFNGPTV